MRDGSLNELEIVGGANDVATVKSGSALGPRLVSRMRTRMRMEMPIPGVQRVSRASTMPIEKGSNDEAHAGCRRK
jgi:hypothetical protein